MTKIKYITDIVRDKKSLDKYIKNLLKEEKIERETGKLQMLISCLNTTCKGDCFPKNGKKEIIELNQKHPNATYELYYSTRSGWGCYYTFIQLIKVFY